MVENKILRGVVSMPSNIFATTNANVSIIFLDTENKKDIVLIDASNMGEIIKEGNNQRTVLTEIEEQQIIDVFNTKEAKADFSVVVSYDDIEAKNYSLSAGQYFDVKIVYVDITTDEFNAKVENFNSNLQTLFEQSQSLEYDIKSNLKTLKYE